MATYPQIGRMRYRIEVQSRQAPLNALGEPVLSWSTVVTVSAGIESLGGAEQWRAGKVEAEITHRVTVRFLSWLTAKHRFLHRGRIFEIDSIQDLDGSGRFQVCLCREVEK